MIAFAGFKRLQAGQPSQDLDFSARARWPLAELGKSTLF
jgi:tRNA A37 threonylcarbamoyltransferase TsaD